MRMKNVPAACKCKYRVSRVSSKFHKLRCLKLHLCYEDWTGLATEAPGSSSWARSFEMKLAISYWFPQIHLRTLGISSSWPVKSNCLTNIRIQKSYVFRKSTRLLKKKGKTIRFFDWRVIYFPIAWRLFCCSYYCLLHAFRVLDGHHTFSVAHSSESINRTWCYISYVNSVIERAFDSVLVTRNVK